MGEEGDGEDEEVEGDEDGEGKGEGEGEEGDDSEEAEGDQDEEDGAGLRAAARPRVYFIEICGDDLGARDGSRRGARLGFGGPNKNRPTLSKTPTYGNV